MVIQNRMVQEDAMPTVLVPVRFLLMCECTCGIQAASD